MRPIRSPRRMSSVYRLEHHLHQVARQIFHRMKAYIVYRIALCIHLEVYLVRTLIHGSAIRTLMCFVQCTSMLILNETIRVDLIVFIAIFAESVTFHRHSLLQ